MTAITAMPKQDSGYELTLGERIQIVDILPQKGSIVDAKILRDLRDSLSFSEQEIQQFNIKAEGQQILWNVAAERKQGPKCISIGSRGLVLISDAIKRLDKEGGISLELLPLCERFYIE